MTPEPDGYRLADNSVIWPDGRRTYTTGQPEDPPGSFSYPPAFGTPIWGSTIVTGGIKRPVVSLVPRASQPVAQVNEPIVPPVASISYPPGYVPPALPAAPGGVTATPGDGQVALAWGASSGATSYSVSRGMAGGGTAPIATGLSAPSYVDTGVTNGVTYSYWVTASNAAGTSPMSSVSTATPMASAPAAPALAAPTPLFTWPRAAVGAAILAGVYYIFGGKKP